MDETKDFKVTDNRTFADGNLNDLPEEEIPDKDKNLEERSKKWDPRYEKKLLSVKLKEEKERKANKKQIRLVKKNEKDGAKAKQQSKVMQCPLCKYKGSDRDFLHNTKAAFSVCTKCGIVFLPVDHVRSIMKIAKAGDKGIIIPGK